MSNVLYINKITYHTYYVCTILDNIRRAQYTQFTVNFGTTLDMLDEYRSNWLTLR